MDKAAATKWEKSDKSFNNYQDFIARKKNRFKLTLVDLLYISNFKGGNASIHEEEVIVNQKLDDYAVFIEKIEKRFKNKRLSILSEKELKELIVLVENCFNLTRKKESKIDGFSISYCSALLNAYFPDLVPILDRRILINLGLVEYKGKGKATPDVSKQGQIKHIENFLKKLLNKLWSEFREKPKMRLRCIDKKYFIQKFQER